MKRMSPQIFAGLLSVATVALGPKAAAQTSDWPAYLHDTAHSSYNQQATAITTTNAGSLVQNWTFTDRPPTQTGQPAVGFNASPTIYNGVVYLGSNTGQFYALNESNGSVLWHRLLGYVKTNTCRAQGVVSTAAVATDPVSGTLMVYVGGGNGFLYALNASNGQIVWKKLVVKVGTTENDGFAWSSPLLLNGVIYMGVSSQCDHPLIRGGIKSYDMHTGTPLHVYFTTPKNTIGASVWTSPTSDGNFIWLNDGNGDFGDAFSMMRLTPDLVFQTKWTILDVQGTDLDWGSSPTLFQATLSGIPTQMVGANEKSGVFYAFNALSLEAGPVWTRQIGTTGMLGAIGTCLAAPIWDAVHSQLFVGSNQTTIQSQTFAGSMRSLDPATGDVIWETGLTAGPVMGTPTLNGAGVLAAGTYGLANPTGNAVYLLDASNGNILTSFPETSPVFSQPVFANNYLFIATSAGVLLAYSP